MKKLIAKVMRFLHRMIAFFLMRFWTQCPHCKNYFGGHQKHALHQVIKGKHYRYLCRHCSHLADKQ